MKKTTTVDIAKRAGVSPTLVSFVVNDNQKHLARMNAKTVERVRRVAEEMGYYRNELFAAARRGQSKFLAILARDVGVEYYARVAEEIMEATETVGYSQKLLKLRDPAEAETAVTRILEYRVCGGVLMGVRDDIARYFCKALARPLFPTLLINCNPVGMKGGIPIVVDNKTAMQDALAFLKKLGHRRVAYVGPAGKEPSHALRRKAFESASSAADNIAPTVIELSWELDDPHTDLVQALQGSKRPTAVIAYSDLAALIVMQVANALHLRVPQDLSLIGFDDNSYAPRITPPLTTFRQNLSVIHDLYIPEFIQSIESEVALNRRKKRSIPADLIERNSTGPAPSGA